MTNKIYRLLLLLILITFAITGYSQTKSDDSTTRPISHDTIVHQGSATKPSYPGGTNSFNAFIANNLIYPECSRKNRRKNITVRVYFVVKYDGTVKDVNVRDATVPECYKNEAVRLIQLSSGNWIPGKFEENGINVLCVMPIEFSLE